MKIFFLRVIASLVNTREANRILFRAIRERDKRKRMNAYYAQQRARYN